MSRGDVADQFLDNNGLAYAGSTISSNLSALGKGGNQVQSFQTSLQSLGGSGLFLKTWRGCGEYPIFRWFEHRPNHPAVRPER